MDYNYEKIVPQQFDAPEIPTRGVGGSPSNELIRKKLEAELRAAEAIGKLKQSIIEKRLALELAAIEAEHKRRKLGLPVYPSHFLGQSSRQQETPTGPDNKNIFKRASLWPKKASSHRLTPQRPSSHHQGSFYKSSQHEGHKGESAYRDSHKHTRNVFKQGVPGYGHREVKLRRDNSYVHSSRSMEDDESLQEIGNEEEEEVAVSDPTQSVVNASPVVEAQQPPNKFKNFFSKLRKNSANGTPTTPTG